MFNGWGDVFLSLFIGLDDDFFFVLLDNNVGEFKFWENNKVFVSWLKLKVVLCWGIFIWKCVVVKRV